MPTKRRKKATKNVDPKRSRAAKKAWRERKAREKSEYERRSRAAIKGWKTKRRKVSEKQRKKWIRKAKKKSPEKPKKRQRKPRFKQVWFGNPDAGESAYELFKLATDYAIGHGKMEEAIKASGYPPRELGFQQGLKIQLQFKNANGRIRKANHSLDGAAALLTGDNPDYEEARKSVVRLQVAWVGRGKVIESGVFLN